MLADSARENGVQPVTKPGEVAAIVKAVVRVAEHWRLSDCEAAGLLGVGPRTWSRMKSATFNGTLNRDRVTRASLIIGIYKGLRLLFNGPLTHDWPTLPNKGDLYAGGRPIDFMIAGGIPAMALVRQQVDGLLGPDQSAPGSSLSQ